MQLPGGRKGTYHWYQSNRERGPDVIERRIGNGLHLVRRSVWTFIRYVNQIQRE